MRQQKCVSITRSRVGLSKRARRTFDRDAGLLASDRNAGLLAGDRDSGVQLAPPHHQLMDAVYAAGANHADLSEERREASASTTCTLAPRRPRHMKQHGHWTLRIHDDDGLWCSSLRIASINRVRYCRYCDSGGAHGHTFGDDNYPALRKSMMSTAKRSVT